MSEEPQPLQTIGVRVLRWFVGKRVSFTVQTQDGRFQALSRALSAAMGSGRAPSEEFSRRFEPASGEFVAVFASFASVAAEPSKCWLRGQVTAVHLQDAGDLVDVWLVDVGTETRLKLWELRRLPQELNTHNVEALAWRFDLKGLLPVGIKFEQHIHEVRLGRVKRWPESVMRTIRERLEDSAFVVTLLVERRAKNKLQGDVKFGDGQTLRSLLLGEQRALLDKNFFHKLRKERGQVNQVLNHVED